MSYYASSGPRCGPIRWDNHLAAIDVRRGRDDLGTIGRATEVGWDADGVSFWRLTMGGRDLPGLWVVVDREFHPAQ
jgi:hypothetical protein